MIRDRPAVFGGLAIVAALGLCCLPGRAMAQSDPTRPRPIPPAPAPPPPAHPLPPAPIPPPLPEPIPPAPPPSPLSVSS